jgi:acyl-CoA thioesterase I
MALPLAATLAIGLILQGEIAAAQDAAPSKPPESAAQPAVQAEGVDPSLSPECRIPGSKLYTLASLRRVKRALRDHRTLKVLAIGSSSTLGGGSSSPAASYPARLEDELERLTPGVDVDVVNRGISGEIAGGATDRLKDVVVEVEPDLVVWQVGTNDALARVDPETFEDTLNETLKWLQAHKFDVVLVDPQYTASLAEDASYKGIVHVIEDVARKNRVPLVHRYDATRYLAEHKERAPTLRNQFQLNDLGYRCMAEHVARAVTVSLLQPEPSQPEPSPQPEPPAAQKPQPELAPSNGPHGP